MVRFTLPACSRIAMFPRDDIRHEVQLYSKHGRDTQLVYEPGKVVSMKSFEDHTFVDIKSREQEYTALVTGPFTVEHVYESPEEEE